ncbi:hypothetical protein D9619_000436 [Psilocybe cf. subviscida]|uniref:G domain-containing protein n=1 Tax=Psilocybe cf. subviscida TaxID=2480587 RepID=A0A8H5F2E7_9AGAR|nr:hypothetical protein D9619_000436 [Psilocybe cf. subviscida]
MFSKPTRLTSSNVMGPTGAGKSTFINMLFGGEERVAVGHSLNSPGPVRKLIIVDTPGYGAGAKLAGVIYLRDICQRRITEPTKKNLEVFDRLCGGDACKSIVLGTTQWARVPADEHKVAGRREQELRDNYWKEMIRKGSAMQRVDDTCTNASPWDLIDTVLLKGISPTLLIQQELMDMDRSLPQTEAAAVLRGRIEELIKGLKSSGASKEEVQALVQ